MHSLLVFLRTTLTGGVLFLLPAVLVGMLLKKAYEVLLPLGTPLAQRVPMHVLGFDGSVVFALLLLLLTCFFAGLMYRLPLTQGALGRLESGLLVYVPGYSLLKSVAADATGAHVEHNMTPVLVRDEDQWSVGFLVEEVDGRCTVFMPEVPKLDSGELAVVPSTAVVRLRMPANQFVRSLRGYGKGLLAAERQSFEGGDKA